jgi:phospholipase/carboxylesterase
MSDASAALLDGPRTTPHAGGKASSLVVLLHGYGADGNDLIGLARYWGPVLPHTAFASPHAPDPCGEAPGGRQWFPLARTDPEKLVAGVTGAAPALDAFLDAELAAHSLTDEALALVGFSQGGMMALHVGPRRKVAPAGIAAFSGLLPAPDRLGEIRHRPPILLVHGDADEVIPAMATYAAARVLANAGFPVEWHIRPRLAHGIDEEGVRFGADFLRRILPG